MLNKKKHDKLGMALGSLRSHSLKRFATLIFSCGEKYHQRYGDLELLKFPTKVFQSELGLTAGQAGQSCKSLEDVGIISKFEIATDRRSIEIYL